MQLSYYGPCSKYYYNIWASWVIVIQKMSDQLIHNILELDRVLFTFYNMMEAKVEIRAKFE
jgi:hypothetical protein